MLNILVCVLVLVAGSSQAALDTSSVASSQDLYMQFQEQKRKIEEELRLMEQRDLQWKEIQSETGYDRRDAVPALNLGSSHNDLSQTPANTSQQAPVMVSQQAPVSDMSDDISLEVELPDQQITIKQFVAVETLEEQAPVRAVAFHPSGECYAVGSNTKILRVCQFPDMSKVTVSYNMSPRKPKILAKKVKHHQGSIYCVSWNTLGTVIATGSNDHTVKCIQWLSDQSVFGSEKSLSVHDGTVRDVSFLSTDQLLSAGAGDCTVCLTDIASGSVVRRYKGHSGHVLTLFPHKESQKFVSGGQDRKALMWDTRMSVPVQTFQTAGSLADSAFASVALDPSPRVLASGHDNCYCSLYDLRQGRLLQAWKPHTDEVRSARFNNDATYFLTGSYDTTVKLMDMQGDITQSLKTVQVAEHMDKVIQCRWHPLLPSFITSSADKTVSCWAIQIDD
ncbi:hypothetical protein EB796_008094 [Bugula neritina]|uniref:WDR37 n=1 Tax=Bugula neritina TaxID=10212 RepID=A0A7J7K5X7_BUGNE|nr:hypothetical protein EB796_008094 [Bugula neritina]